MLKPLQNIILLFPGTELSGWCTCVSLWLKPLFSLPGLLALPALSCFALLVKNCSWLLRCTVPAPQRHHSLVKVLSLGRQIWPWCLSDQLGKGLPTSLESGLGTVKVKDGLDICWVLLDRPCGLAGWQVHSKGCRVVHHKHGACQPPSHHLMGKHQGTLEGGERSPDTAQVCYESGLKPSK